MYCPSCGMEIDDNSRFCSTCGEKITDVLNDLGIRYKSGDQSAFQEIYDDTVSWVRSYVYNRVSSNNVEDCLNSMNEIISGLCEEQKQCITLRYMEGFKVKEIADRLNVSEMEVKVSIESALKQMEAKVKELQDAGNKLFYFSSICPMPFLL